MAFDPKTFIVVGKDLLTGKTEAHYRSIINRAYYGVFGYIRNTLKVYVESGSVHQEVIKTLGRSTSVNHKKVGKRLEGLFLKRKDADYKHDREIKASGCEYYIKEAEDIIELFEKKDD